MFFNVSKEEIVAAGELVEDLVQLEDGSYLASTRVVHNVHCLVSPCLMSYNNTKIYISNQNALEANSTFYLQRRLLS